MVAPRHLNGTRNRQAPLTKADQLNMFTMTMFHQLEDQCIELLNLLNWTQTPGQVQSWILPGSISAATYCPRKYIYQPQVSNAKTTAVAKVKQSSNHLMMTMMQNAYSPKQLRMLCDEF